MDFDDNFTIDDSWYGLSEAEREREEEEQERLYLDHLWAE